MRIFEIDMGRLDTIDRDLYNYVRNELGWPGDTIALAKRYPLDKPTYCFRGMNFSTKEAYEDFIAKIQAGSVEISSSSWTPRKTTGEDFAQHKKTYTLNLAVAAAEDEYQKSSEAIHGYKGVLLGMMITPAMKPVDVRKFDYAAEDEILLPPGTYELKVIKTFDKFADTIEPNDASTRFLSVEPGTREYEYLLKKYKDQFSDEAKIKLFKDLFAAKRSSGSLYKSKKEEFYHSVFSDTKPSEYFTHELKANVFPIQALQLAVDGYFPKQYNDLILKMANKSLDRFAKDYGSDEKTVMDKYDISRVGKMFDLLGRSGEFAQIQRSKINKPYQHMQTARVKQINAIRDPKEHQAAMHQYMDDIKDLISRI